MNFTFDTNVLLSATLWDGSVSQKLLFECIRNDIEIFSSHEILGEYKRILKRDFNYNEKEASEMTTEILKFVIVVIPKYVPDIVKKDPSDNKIIACAIQSKSKYLISYDKHLLDLKEFKNIKIISPENARKLIENN